MLHEQPLSATLSSRDRWLLLFSLMISLFVGALDQTVVSTATPRILADLGGFNLLSWLFTSYMLTSTVVIPLVGKLGDQFGRKLFLVGGIALFMVSSGACGAAPNMESLIIFRAVQGLGGGMIFASVFASLGDIFTPAERGKYVGFFTGTFSLASLVGPTLGGFMTDHGGWRLIFLINVPIGLIAIPAIWKTLPGKPRGAAAAIDFVGATILAAASVFFLLAFVWAGDKYAWGSPQIIGLLVASAVLTGLFIVQELRHPEPILPLHLFQNRTFLVSNLVVFTFGLGVFGAFQYLGLFVQTALHASATASGIVATPQSLGVLFASIVGGQVLSRVGRYKWQTVFGCFLIVIGEFLLTLLDADIPKWHISVFVVVLGLGFGLVLPTMSLIVQNAVPFKYMGVATSSSQFFRQMGSVIGIAIFGSILTNAYASELDDRFTPDDRAAVGPAVTTLFEDPTARLREEQFAATERQVLALPDGEALLGRIERASAVAMAEATQLIFLGSFIAAILSLLFALFLKDIPLQRRTAPAPAPAEDRQPHPEGAVPQFD
ncbi:MAG: MFS transporter [Dehalococcoidia bacterium]|nr:MFS transporter [Dehalococcoidia bacterium]